MKVNNTNQAPNVTKWPIIIVFISLCIVFVIIGLNTFANDTRATSSKELGSDFTYSNLSQISDDLIKEYQKNLSSSMSYEQDNINLKENENDKPEDKVNVNALASENSLSQDELAHEIFNDKPSYYQPDDKSKQQFLKALSSNSSVFKKSAIDEHKSYEDSEKSKLNEAYADLNRVKGQNNDLNSAYSKFKVDDFTLKNKVVKNTNKFSLMQGTVIRAMLISAINSDVQGQVIAQVTDNILDSINANHVLIPRGSRLLGEYASSQSYGQERLMVGFNRIIFPNGDSLNLGAMPSQSMNGVSGMDASVNSHFLKLLSQTLLLGTISATVNVTHDRYYDANSSLSYEDALSDQVTASLGQAMAKVIEKNINVSPTLEVNFGYEFNVVLTKDIGFDHEYKL